ncbi:MAG: signal peptidase II [Candidatus Aminicenantaceae bacterium]
MKDNSLYFMIILLLSFVDQLTKTIVSTSFNLYESRIVIPGFFNLTYIKNRGAIFGFFSTNQSFFIYALLTLASIAALGLVVYYFYKTSSSERFLKISLSLILAGALGNLTDRLFRGAVVDFLDFYAKDWHWPFFNIADSCITVGAILLLYIFLFKKGDKCFPSS